MPTSNSNRPPTSRYDESIINLRISISYKPPTRCGYIQDNPHSRGLFIVPLSQLSCVHCGTGQFVFAIRNRLRYISRRARLLHSPWLPPQTCTSSIPLTPKGNPCYASACGGAASSRFLIVGAVGPPNRNRLPAARHFVFYRPPAGAPRRLRPRSASLLVERYAHDRTAVVMIAIVCWEQSL